MLSFILKRLLVSVPTLVLVALLSFTLMRYDFTLGPVTLPGMAQPVLPAFHLKNPIDPLATLKANPQISPDALKKETQRLGLDQPFHEQFRRWASGLLTINPHALQQGRWWAIWAPQLGQTYNGQPVEQVMGKRLANTLLLNVVSLLTTWLLALPLGVYAAVHWRSTTDRLLTVLGAVGMALPGFVIALLLAVVAVKTGWLPVGGLTSDNYSQLPWYAQLWDVALHLVLPVTVLTVAGIAGIQRQVRSNLLDVLGTDYIRMARAKGLPENRVLYTHALRVAINPLITLLGFEFAGLLGGGVLLETVLGYPGVGYLTYQAVMQQDTNLVMASLLLSAIMLILGNLLADILLSLCDPRISLESASQ
jgi:peptide/nickel transport system permease protein